MKIKEKKKIAFDFILERLMALEPHVKPMFGAHGIYVGEKIVLITRDRDSHPEDNGVWIATGPEYHASLKKELPSMRSIFVLSNGKGETNWQTIPADADDFESSIEKICSLILKNDPRIGRIPKGRKKKTKK